MPLWTHGGKLAWHLIRKHHPYLYARRAFLAGELSAAEAALYVVADKDALDEIAESRPGMHPLLVAEELVQEVWAPAVSLIAAANLLRAAQEIPRMDPWNLPDEEIDRLMDIASDEDDDDDDDDEAEEG